MNGASLVLAQNANSVKRMDAMTPVLCKWFGDELMKVHAQLPTSAGGILMGCPIWGAEYIDRMVRYTLPTLGTEKNLNALAGKASMVFYGVPHERDALWKHTRWLRQVGIHTVWRNLPLDILDATEGQDKYGLLSAVQNLLAHEAGHTERGLHMFMPDHLYCEGYFESLARLGGKHDGIVQQGMSANIETAAPDIEYWRQAGGDVLAIPARELGGLALKHIHARTGRTIMNNLKFGEEWPKSHQATWIGKTAVHMASAPQNIAWLSPQLCLDAPIAFTSTMDMLPCEYIPPGVEYMAGEHDGLAFCELSDPRNVAPVGYTDFDEFLVRHWQQVAFTNDYQRYFERRCMTPIPEQTEFMADEEIERQHKAISNALMAGKTRTMEMYFRSQCPLRWPEEAFEPLKVAADD